MKRDELERPEVENGGTPQKKSVLEKLARFGEYTTPAMKELLFYGDGKMRKASSPT